MITGLDCVLNASKAMKYSSFSRPLPVKLPAGGAPEVPAPSASQTAPQMATFHKHVSAPG